VLAVAGASGTARALRMWVAGLAVYLRCNRVVTQTNQRGGRSKRMRLSYNERLFAHQKYQDEVAGDLVSCMQGFSVDPKEQARLARSHVSEFRGL